MKQTGKKRRGRNNPTHSKGKIRRSFAMAKAGRGVGHWSQLGVEEQPFALCTLCAVRKAPPCKHRAVREQRHAELRTIFREIKLMAFFPESLGKHCWGAVPARKCTPPWKVCLPTQHLERFVYLLYVWVGFHGADMLEEKAISQSVTSRSFRTSKLPHKIVLQELKSQTRMSLQFPKESGLWSEPCHGIPSWSSAF